MIAAAHTHRGTVAVHHLAHLRVRQEHRRAAVVGHEKAVAVGMALDAPGDQGDALRHEQRAGAVLHHLACTLQNGERLVENAPLALADLQARGELIGRERRARAIQGGDDLARVINTRVPLGNTRVPLGTRLGRGPRGAIAAPERCFSGPFL
jgi:hypothetical protein